MISPARQWALAVAGPLTELNGHDLALLGGRAPTAESRADLLAVLERDWSAGTRPELLETLGWLAREGHRKAYNDACRLDVTATATLNPWETIEKVIEDKKVLGQVYFTRAHRDRIGPRSLVAWDAGRLITIAGWGVVTGLLSEDEAWAYILPMAQLAQHIYSSWDELGKHYLLGYEFWSGEWDGELARGHLSLLSNPASPWRALPWRTDLGAHGVQSPLQPIVFEPPPPPQPLLKKVRVPGNGGGVHDGSAPDVIPSTGFSGGIRIAVSAVIFLVVAASVLVSTGIIPLFGDNAAPPTPTAGLPKPASPARPVTPPKKR